MGRYVDMAWLGLAGTPYLCAAAPNNPPPLQGALEDQISLGSQIRVRLTVECPRKTDGFGIEMGGGSLIPVGPSGAPKYVEPNETNYYYFFFFF